MVSRAGKHTCSICQTVTNTTFPVER